jgi:hypothetical protein
MLTMVSGDNYYTRWRREPLVPLSQVLAKVRLRKRNEEFF